MENLELELKFIQSRLGDVLKELEELKIAKTNIELDLNLEIGNLELANKNLMTELKYNRMAVKYLRESNEMMLDELRRLKGVKKDEE